MANTPEGGSIDELDLTELLNRSPFLNDNARLSFGEQFFFYKLSIL